MQVKVFSSLLREDVSLSLSQVNQLHYQMLFGFSLELQILTFLVFLNLLWIRISWIMLFLSHHHTLLERPLSNSLWDTNSDYSLAHSLTHDRPLCTPVHLIQTNYCSSISPLTFSLHSTTFPHFIAFESWFEIFISIIATVQLTPNYCSHHLFLYTVRLFVSLSNHSNLFYGNFHSSPVI